MQSGALKKHIKSLHTEPPQSGVVTGAGTGSTSITPYPISFEPFNSASCRNYPIASVKRRRIAPTTQLLSFLLVVPELTVIHSRLAYRILLLFILQLQQLSYRPYQ